MEIFWFTMSSLEQSQENEIQEIVHPISLSNDDKQQEIVRIFK